MNQEDERYRITNKGLVDFLKDADLEQVESIDISLNRKNSHKPTILVVDANQDDREKIIGCLNSNKYRILQPETAYLALHFLAEDRNNRNIKLIVVDLLLPVYNGEDFIRESKRICKDFTVVVVSAHLKKYRKIDLVDVPPELIFEKPFDSDKFATKCEQLLQER